MRPPAQLWRCEPPPPDQDERVEGDEDLAAVMRRYVSYPWARTSRSASWVPPPDAFLEGLHGAP